MTRVVVSSMSGESRVEAMQPQRIRNCLLCRETVLKRTAGDHGGAWDHDLFNQLRIRSTPSPYMRYSILTTWETLCLYP